MKWSYGMTTCRERYDTQLMQHTLASLHNGGFPQPVIYLDDWRGTGKYDNVVSRDIVFRPYGNWLLGLVELLIREPNADRYAMFQDDLECYKNLRLYLESCEIPSNGYWNLFTNYENEDIVRNQQPGWYEASINNPKTKAQTGRGALALVFSRSGVETLLQQSSVWSRLSDAQNGWKNIDGAVVRAMNGAGWREYIHNPTLVQHVGEQSSIFVTDHKSGGLIRKGRHKIALTWRGEKFDALKLLPRSDESNATR